MPIYEYECKSCTQRFERRQSFSEPPVTECPECGGTVKKVLQAVGIVFKGSGWYKNDSRPAESSGESGSTGKDGAGKDGKTDAAAKPADSKPAISAAASKTTSSPPPPSTSAPAAASASSGAGVKN